MAFNSYFLPNIFCSERRNLIIPSLFLILLLKHNLSSSNLLSISYSFSSVNSKFTKINFGNSILLYILKYVCEIIFLPLSYPHKGHADCTFVNFLLIISSNLTLFLKSFSVNSIFGVKYSVFSFAIVHRLHPSYRWYLIQNKSISFRKVIGYNIFAYFLKELLSDIKSNSGILFS